MLQGSCLQNCHIDFIKMAKKQKYYVVWEGRRIGVYQNWDDCKKQIDGFTDAKYKSFDTKAQAEEAFKNESQNYIGKETKTTLSNDQKLKLGYPTHQSICVDAACNVEKGIVEYKGVLLPEKEVIFLMGPYAGGTNNIGEYLAIVHALSFCKKNNLLLPIYTDSKTALAWIRNKKVNTTLQPNVHNTEIFQLVERANKWLHSNTYDNPILKWKTEKWGENPADFGRK